MVTDLGSTQRNRVRMNGTYWGWQSSEGPLTYWMHRAPPFSPWDDEPASSEVTTPSRRSPPPFLPSLPGGDIGGKKRKSDRARRRQYLWVRVRSWAFSCLWGGDRGGMGAALCQERAEWPGKEGES